ncbi:Osmotin-like protein OSM34, partial [Mucuna pruriens]
MAVTKSLSIFLMVAISCVAAAQATNFNITNRCNYTVWAAAVPGGGVRLDTNQSWSINVTNGTTGGRIWGRTNCTFDSAGRGKCLTGDCNGVLQCNNTYGTPPNTLVEYALNQYNNLDFYDISLVDGFNIPIEFTPTFNCTSVQCAADITGECPTQLQVPGGCNNPCTVFNTTQYCCTSGSSSCGPTDYSKFFKDRCPDAYSYPMDDATSTFTCMGGSDYGVIVNNCPYTVWAAASPGGGRRLDRGQTWNLWVNPGTAMARIWGRTGCNFDGSGHGRCQTGDCTGGLNCQGWGVPPNTLAEFALNQYANQDFYDISLVDGFNIPMDFYPLNGGCHKLSCTADINGQCPGPLRAPGGCNNPCTVFKTNEYCCTNGQGSCGPTNYSRFFKDRCHDSYSYPQDDPTSTFTCSSGSNYRVVFCPLGYPHVPLLMPGSTTNEY